MSARNGQVVRQWRLLRALRVRRLTLAQLADLGEVTERTIRRDLEALEQAGFPLVRDAVVFGLDAEFL